MFLALPVVRGLSRRPGKKLLCSVRGRLGGLGGLLSVDPQEGEAFADLVSPTIVGGGPGQGQVPWFATAGHSGSWDAGCRVVEVFPCFGGGSLLCTGPRSSPCLCRVRELGFLYLLSQKRGAPHRPSSPPAFIHHIATFRREVTLTL